MKRTIPPPLCVGVSLFLAGCSGQTPETKAAETTIAVSAASAAGAAGAASAAGAAGAPSVASIATVAGAAAPAASAARVEPPPSSEDRLRDEVDRWKKTPFRDHGTSKDGIGQSSADARALGRGIDRD